MASAARRGDEILAWGTTIIVIGGGLALYELGWRWYLVVGLVVAYAVLLAWQRRGTPPPASD